MDRSRACSEPDSRRSRAATRDRLGLRSLLGGSTVVFSCRVIGAFAAFATQVLLARWLGADELGAYVVAFSLTLLLGAMGELGFGAAALRFIPGAQAEGDVAAVRGFLRGSCAAVAIGSSVLCFLAILGALALQTLEPTTRLAPFVVASLAIPLMAFLHLFGAIANGFGWLGSAFIPANVLRPLLAIAAMTIAWRWGHGLNVTTALLMQAGAILICVLALGVVIRARTTALAAVPPRYRTGLWVRTSLPLLVIGVLIHYFPDATILLLGAYLPSDDIAVFNAAYRIALFIAFGLSSIDAWFTPAAAQLHSNGELAKLQALTLSVTKLRLIGAAVALGALAAFGPQALGVFGDDFRTGYWVLMLLAGAQLVQAAVGPVTALLSVTGHQGRCVPVFGFALVAVVLLITLLVPWFGIEGAAASVLGVTVGWSIWLHKLVRDHLGIRPSPFSPFRSVAVRPESN